MCSVCMPVAACYSRTLVLGAKYKSEIKFLILKRIQPTEKVLRLVLLQGNLFPDYNVELYMNTTLDNLSWSSIKNSLSVHTLSGDYFDQNNNFWTFCSQWILTRMKLCRSHHTHNYNFVLHLIKWAASGKLIKLNPLSVTTLPRLLAHFDFHCVCCQ